MAIWKDPFPAKKTATSPLTDTADADDRRTDTMHTDLPRVEHATRAESPIPVASPAVLPPRPVGARDPHESRESLIAADIAIEGKIEGAGHVRIAGRFNGDVHVQGNLAIEDGAKITGGVRAATVTVGGELEGNIDSATRVELLSTGVLTGDVKAGSLTVAAGSRMRGQVEFGWDDRAAPARSIGKDSSSSV